MVLARPKLLPGDMLVMTALSKALAAKLVCPELIKCCHATSASFMTANDQFLAKSFGCTLSQGRSFTQRVDVFRAR